LLSDEVEPLDTDRSIRTAAGPTASRARVLAAAAEGRSAPAKVTVTRPAASDEPLGPFSAAALVTLLFTHLDIQDTEDTEDETRVGLVTNSRSVSVNSLPPWFNFRNGRHRGRPSIQQAARVWFKRL